MKEYELYLPLNYNDGSPVEFRKIEQIGEKLLKQFGGLTYFPQPNEGRWTLAHVVYHDEIVIFRVLSDNTKVARRFFKRLKAELKSDLQQEEILIVEKDAEII